MAAITDDNFGAWLVRCNPATWDLASFLAAGGQRLTSCSVVENYRSARMRPGDPILLWVSGNGKVLARGLWGLGEVTAGVRDEPARQHPDEPHPWLDERARRAVNHAVFVDIPVFDVPVADAELRAASIDDLEVQRVPMGSNPSWVSRDQLARLRPLLPAAP